jgi:hypothetical protein
MEVVCVGNDVGSDNSPQLFHEAETSSTTSTWNLPTMLGGPWPPNRRPFLTRSANGRLEIFIVGTDGRMYHRWQTSLKSDGLWDWNSTWVQLGKEEWPRSSIPLLRVMVMAD